MGLLEEVCVSFLQLKITLYVSMFDYHEATILQQHSQVLFMLCGGGEGGIGGI